MRSKMANVKRPPSGRSYLGQPTSTSMLQPAAAVLRWSQQPSTPSTSIAHCQVATDILSCAMQRPHSRERHSASSLFATNLDTTVSDMAETLSPPSFKTADGRQYVEQRQKSTPWSVRDAHGESTTPDRFDEWVQLARVSGAKIKANALISLCKRCRDHNNIAAIDTLTPLLAHTYQRLPTRDDQDSFLLNIKRFVPPAVLWSVAQSRSGSVDENEADDVSAVSTQHLNAAVQDLSLSLPRRKGNALHAETQQRRSEHSQAMSLAKVLVAAATRSPNRRASELKNISQKLLIKLKWCQELRSILQVHAALMECKTLHSPLLSAFALIAIGHASENGAVFNDADVEEIKSLVHDCVSFANDDIDAHGEGSFLLEKLTESIRVGMKHFYREQDYEYIGRVYELCPRMGPSWEVARALVLSHRDAEGIHLFSDFFELSTRIPSLSGGLPAKLLEEVRTAFVDVAERHSHDMKLLTRLCLSAYQWPVANLPAAVVLEWVLEGQRRLAPLSAISIIELLETLSQVVPFEGFTVASVTYLFSTVAAMDTQSGGHQHQSELDDKAILQQRQLLSRSLALVLQLPDDESRRRLLSSAVSASTILQRGPSSAKKAKKAVATTKNQRRSASSLFSAVGENLKVDTANGDEGSVEHHRVAPRSSTTRTQRAMALHLTRALRTTEAVAKVLHQTPLEVLHILAITAGSLQAASREASGPSSKPVGTFPAAFSEALTLAIETKTKDTTSRTAWQCHGCQTFNPPNAKTCRLCGGADAALWQCSSCSGLTNTGFTTCSVCDSERTASSPIVPLATWQCTRCAKRNSNNHPAFCGHCFAPNPHTVHKLEPHSCATCGHINKLGVISPWCSRCGTLHPSCGSNKKLWTCDACTTLNPWTSGACSGCKEKRPGSAKEVPWYSKVCDACGSPAAAWLKACPTCYEPLSGETTVSKASDISSSTDGSASFNTSTMTIVVENGEPVVDGSGSAVAEAKYCSVCSSQIAPYLSHCPVCYHATGDTPTAFSEMHRYWVCLRHGCLSPNDVHSPHCHSCGEGRPTLLERLNYLRFREESGVAGMTLETTIQEPASSDEVQNRIGLEVEGSFGMCGACGHVISPNNIVGRCEQCGTINIYSERKSVLPSEATEDQANASPLVERRRVQLWMLLRTLCATFSRQSKHSLEGTALLTFAQQVVAALLMEWDAAKQRCAKAAADGVQHTEDGDFDQELVAEFSALPWHSRDTRTHTCCDEVLNPVHADGAAHLAIVMLRHIIRECCQNAVSTQTNQQVTLKREWLATAVDLVEIANETTLYDEIGFSCLSELCLLIRPQDTLDVVQHTRRQYLLDMKLHRRDIVKGSCCEHCLSTDHSSDECRSWRRDRRRSSPKNKKKNRQRTVANESNMLYVVGGGVTTMLVS